MQAHARQAHAKRLAFGRVAHASRIRLQCVTPLNLPRRTRLRLRLRTSGCGARKATTAPIAAASNSRRCTTVFTHAVARTGRDDVASCASGTPVSGSPVTRTTVTLSTQGWMAGDSAPDAKEGPQEGRGRLSLVDGRPASRGVSLRLGTLTSLSTVTSTRTLSALIALSLNHTGGLPVAVRASVLRRDSVASVCRRNGTAERFYRLKGSATTDALLVAADCAPARAQRRCISRIHRDQRHDQPCHGWPTTLRMCSAKRRRSATPCPHFTA